MTGATLASNEDAPSLNSHLPTSSNSPNVSLPYLHSPALTSSPARLVPPTPTPTPTRASSDLARPPAPRAPPHHRPHPPQLNYQYQTHLNQPHAHRSQPLQTHHHVGAIRRPTNPTRRREQSRAQRQSREPKAHTRIHPRSRPHTHKETHTRHALCTTHHAPRAAHRDATIPKRARPRVHSHQQNILIRTRISSRTSASGPSSEPTPKSPPPAPPSSSSSRASKNGQNVSAAGDIDASREARCAASARAVRSTDACVID